MVVNNKGVKVANKDYEIDGVDVTQALDYVPNDKDRKLVKYMERMFDASKRARAHKVPRWRRNEELYNGEFLKPFNLPKYKTRIVANTIHSTVETIYSILTDRFPKVDIMPKTEEQVDGARKSQEAVESEMRKNKALRGINGMKRDALVYGNGFLKLTYKEGKVDYTVPDIYTVFVDPLATNIDDAKCVIFAQPTYLKDVREMFERGKNVKSEGKLDEYKYFIRAGGESSGKLYLTTWAGKVLLQHVEAPTDFIPVVTFKNYSDEHRFWGKGEPEIVEPLAVGTAILLSQSLDNVIYHGNPAWVMSKSLAKTPGNRPSDKPGQVFWTNGPHEQINRLPAGNISSSNLPLAQYMMQLTDTISGIHDITQGRNPSGVTAAKAISALQEASQQIIRAKEREVGADAMIDVNKQTLSILVNNYEQGIMIRREGNSGYEFEELQPYDLDSDMDYKYVPGSTMPESRASRIDQALEYIQLGLITPEQFWRWHEKDISRDILEEMVEQKQAQMDAQQQDMDVINNSTDENEIYEALLRQKAQMGEVPEEQGE